MKQLAIALMFWVALTGNGAAQTASSFSGLPVVQLLPEGRGARVVVQFSFTDGAGIKWVVPTNTIVDGASIPRPFWTLIGGPWDGNYRDASIIHDFYCVRRNRSWQAVHRVFYEAMRARSVDPLKAKIMYYAVYRFGPRWTKLSTKVPSVGFDGQPTMVNKTIVVDQPAAAYDSSRVERDQQAIVAGDLTLEQIEALADST